jgi:hypothetical protein
MFYRRELGCVKLFWQGPRLRVHGGCQGEQAALALAEATVQLRDPSRERNRVWQMDFSEFETTRGGIWRICSVIGCA